MDAFGKMLTSVAVIAQQKDILLDRKQPGTLFDDRQPVRQQGQSV
jgi:hypothetical protein